MWSKVVGVSEFELQSYWENFIKQLSRLIDEIVFFYCCNFGAMEKVGEGSGGDGGNGGKWGDILIHR